MPRRNKAEDLTLVEQAVEDHIADTGRLPSTTEIISKVDLGDAKIRAVLEELVRSEKLTAVYEAPKNPTIYLPTYMYDSLLREQRAPGWVSAYGFKEADKIKRKIRDQERTLTEYKLIEVLLYGTGRRLEDSVARAFSILEFEELETPYEDPDSWDLSFEYEGEIYILDVKGKSKWADKSDVAQLQQWLEKYIDMHSDKDPSRIRGGIVINHFKDVDPVERWPANPERVPVSVAGERYLKLGGRLFITTVSIYEVVSQVMRNELSPEKGRQAVIANFHKELSK